MAEPGFLTRATQAVRYTLSGVTPQTWFSPQQPLPPQSQESAGRQSDYPVAYNLNYMPRSDERVKFWRLKALAQNCGLLRTVMETQKDLVTATDWNIKPREIAPGKRPAAGADQSVMQLEAFFRAPDRDHDWSQWLGALLDQAFVLDALTIYRRRDFGGRPYAFELIDGATIRPLIDGRGRRPAPPDPAYQQILKGVPAVDYSTDELLYYPKNVRADHRYGYGPVEQIIDIVETTIERLKSQKSYFTEGNLVDGLFSGPVEWKTDQIKAWQGYWDSIFKGQVAMRRVGFWVPNGTKFDPIKQPPLKDEFDEWLARLICAVFRASPQPFIRQVARGNQESQQEVAEESGVAVYLEYVKRIMDRLLTEDFQRPDLEFVWSDDREFDPLTSAQIDDIRLRNGSRTLNEVRDRNGEDPIPDGDTTLIYTGLGAVTLDSIVRPPPPAPPIIAPHPGAPINPALADPAPKPSGEKAGSEQPGAERAHPAEKLAKAIDVRGLAPSPDRPRALKAERRLKAVIAPILAAAGRHAAMEARVRLTTLGKAASDEAPSTADDVAAAIVGASLLGDLAPAIVGDLTRIAEESADLALDAVAAALPKPASPGPTAAGGGSAATAGATTSLGNAAVPVPILTPGQPNSVTTMIGTATRDELTDQVAERAVAWASARAAEMVSIVGDDNIVAATRSAIRDVIAAGLGDNLGTAKIAANIEIASAFAPERAALIAQTEIAGANSQGALIGYKAARDAGVQVRKEWLAEPTACDACATNRDGGPINLDDDFPSGDPCPPGHPNCRCAVSPVVGDVKNDGE